MKVVRTLVVCWVLSSMFWIYGCSLIQPFTLEEKPPPETQSAAPQVKYFTHKIKWSGENLIRISWWYTGAENNWLRIVEANPLIDPRRIQIGDSVVIPENLLITREPMPISYRAPITTEITKPPEPSEEEAIPNTRAVELFGPIDIETQTDHPGKAPPSLLLETID